jgi:uncharacterized protein involved in exopolysaccharide biosynthesis
MIDSPTPANEHGEMTRSIVEPPEGFVFRAIARNKLIVLVAAIVLAGAGAAVGASRNHSDSTYTAEATLQVGQVNPNSPGFYGYVQSSAALATAFSRAITAEGVLTTVHKKLGLTQAQAMARLSAAPIPESPTFRVFATGPTQASAVQLANVAAASISSYVSEVNSANPEAPSLLSAYRSAALELRKAVVKYDLVNGGRTASQLTRLTAQAEVSTAGLKLDALGSAYKTSVSTQAPRSGLVTLLAGATSATSNRDSKIALYGLVGLLIGILLGCCVAVVRESRLGAGRAQSHDAEPPSQAPA